MKFLYATIVILLISFCVNATEEGKLPRSERVFIEGIFENYHNQLITFVHKAIKKHPSLLDHSEDCHSTEISHFIEHLLSPISDSPEAKKAYHEKMILTLRALIDTINMIDANNAEAAHFLSELCEWMYTEVDLLTAQYRFISDSLPLSIFEDDSKALENLLQDSYQHVEGNPHFGGSLPSNGKDSHLNGDLPSKLFSFGQTKIIRTPIVLNVNKENAKLPGTEFEIFQEFKQFLRFQASQGKTHLYVNLTAKNEKEYNFSQTIQQLDSDTEIQKAIIVVRLDRNSPFHTQENAREIQSSDAFMKDFIQSLMNPQCYSWSARLNIVEWQTTLNKMLKEIHEAIFQGKSELSIVERQQFIDLMNLKIVVCLMDRFHPDSANISCKGSIDRGPSLYTLLYIYSLNQKKSLSFEEKRLVATLLLAPGILERNNPIYLERVERLVQTIPLLKLNY